MQSIQVTEELYRRLSEQAARLRLTPEQLLERLVAAPQVAELDTDLAMPRAGSEAALAAVGRLTQLFATRPIRDLDTILADPMLSIANADLDALPR